MERPGVVVLLLGLLAAAAAPSAAATVAVQPGGSCEPSILATQVSLFCAPDMPTAQCCEPVVAAVDLGGGVPCLCRVASQPQLVLAGLNATHLLTLYTACGGLRPGGARLAAACEGPSPPPAVVSAPPPSAPRRKQPAREAPPPPPQTDKPSPPPQQHDSAPHGKATPTHPATSPLAPAAAGPPPPQPPHSGSSSQLMHLHAATLLLLIAVNIALHHDDD